MATDHHRHGRLNLAELECFRLLEDNSNDDKTLHLLGMIAHQRRDLRRAAQRLERAIALSPDIAMYHCHLGEVCRAMGNARKGLSLCETALRIHPGSAEAHNNLGLALLDLKEWDRAESAFRKALALVSDYAPAYGNLGHALREQQRQEEAIESYRRALDLAPNLASAHINLGGMLLGEGKLNEALHHCREALRLRPRLGDAHNNMGSVLRARGQLQDAVKCHRNAAELVPGNARFHANLASVLAETNEPLQAIEVYLRAQQIDPEMPEIDNNLGQLYNETGDLEKAYDCFRKAIRRRPNAVAPYVNIATFHRDNLTKDDMEIMGQLLERPTLDERQRAALYFGRAHVFDSDKDFDGAAEGAEHGNHFQAKWLGSQEKTYSPENYETLLDNLMRVFDRSHFERVAGWGPDTEMPVFIIGLPRSGTTLTEQILASHPDVFGAGEPRYAYEGYQFLPRIMKSKAAPIDCVPIAHREHLRDAAARHLNILRGLAPDAARVVDKMPENHLYLGWIVSLFPKARVIHCRRDVRDVAVSCWITHFKDLRWTNRQDHIAHRIQNYRRAMDHWRSHLPVPMLEIDYEETVADVESVARKLLDWVGLSWHPSCLAFHKAKRPVRTASLSQVRQPIYSKSVGRWKNYERHLGKLFEQINGAAPPA